MSVSVPILLTFLTAVVTALAAVFVQRRSTAAEGRVFALFCLTVAWWSACVALEAVSPSLSTKLFFSKLQYLGIVPLPVFWLLFTLNYTGLGHLATRARRLALFVLPTLTLLFVATNKVHGLIYRTAQLGLSNGYTNLAVTHGVWFWVHTFYSYLLLFTGLLVLVYGLVRNSRAYRARYLLLIAASLFPLAANLLFLNRSNLLMGIDPTPLGFALSCLVIAPALVRRRFLELLPVAHRAVFETLPVAVLVLGRDRRIVDLNPEAQHLLGTPAELALGQLPSSLLPAWDELVTRYEKEVELSRPSPVAVSVQLGGKTRQLEVRTALLRAPGDLKTRGQVVMAQDVTERNAYEQMAYHDPLTELPNRRLFELEAASALTLAEREGWQVALLYLDLDKFKPVNDRYGHDVGDALLQLTAQRLREVSRSADLLARLGGDEFVLLAQHVSETEARQLAERVVDALREPVQVAGHTVQVGGSVGIAFYPDDATEFSALVRCADTAMYQAKLEETGIYATRSKHSKS